MSWMSFTYTLKRKGPRGLPCLTPLRMGIHPMLVSRILVWWFIWVSLIAFTMCAGTPHTTSFCIMISLLTLSNALEKSTRRSQVSCFCLSFSSMADISCSYYSIEDLPLMAPYCVAAMISFLFSIARRIVSSYSFTMLFMSDIGL